MRAVYLFSIFFLVGFISACSNNGGKIKPNPLATIQKPKVSLKQDYVVSTGLGAGNKFLSLPSGVYKNSIYASDYRGTITSVNLKTGKVIWKENYKAPISSGVSVSTKFLMFGTSDARIFVLDRLTGRVLWKRTLSNEVLSKPLYYKGRIFVKTSDNVVTAFQSNTGNKLWSREEETSEIALRTSSVPIAFENTVIIGFSNGRLISYTLSGSQKWSKSIVDTSGVNPMERILDIDVDPFIIGSNLYVAGYQGNIVSINLYSRKVNWKRALSTHSGFDIQNNALFVTDTDGNIMRLNRNTGKVKWKQNKLKHRNLSAPTVNNGLVFVGDGFGYLHVLSKITGRLLGRIFVDSTGIFTRPIVKNNRVFVITRAGLLFSYVFKK